MHERLPLIGEPLLQALSVKLYVPMNEHRVIGRQDRTDLVGGHLETPERVSRPAHALPVEAGSHPFGMALRARPARGALRVPRVRNAWRSSGVICRAMGVPPSFAPLLM